MKAIGQDIDYRGRCEIYKYQDVCVYIYVCVALCACVNECVSVCVCVRVYVVMNR